MTVWPTMNVQLPTQAAIRSATRSPRVRTFASALSISAMIATFRRVNSSIECMGPMNRPSSSETTRIHLVEGLQPEILGVGRTTPFGTRRFKATNSTNDHENSQYP